MARFLRSQDRPLLVVVDQFEDVLRPVNARIRTCSTCCFRRQTRPTCGLPGVDLACRLPARLAVHSGFPHRLNERLYLLSPLTAEQMRQAVICPASAQGVGFEPGLADQILSDAADVPLPLLQFTLTKLWGTQRRGH